MHMSKSIIINLRLGDKSITRSPTRFLHYISNPSSSLPDTLMERIRLQDLSHHIAIRNLPLMESSHIHTQLGLHTSGPYTRVEQYKKKSSVVVRYLPPSLHTQCESHSKSPSPPVPLQLLNSIKMGSISQSPYADPLITERAIDEPRPLKVIYIGAGISGILAAIQFPKYVPNLELAIYEKNADVGGTWFENRYPGCACG